MCVNPVNCLAHCVSADPVPKKRVTTRSANGQSPEAFTAPSFMRRRAVSYDTLQHARQDSNL